MKINPLQFNFIQPKQQNVVKYSFVSNNLLQQDVVSFTANNRKETPRDKMKKLVPKHKGIIYKKVCDENENVIKKIPVEVDIVKSSPHEFQFQKDEDVVGYVKLSYIPEEDCGGHESCSIYRDYKEEGISGTRIEVEMIRNIKYDEYGGIGHLADLLEVACCKELDIKPNIVSYSFDDVAPLHYKRGKRFIPYEKCYTPYEMEMLNLGGENPNDIIQKIVESTPENECYDTSPIKTNFLLMYMPEKMIQKLEEELKEHPIF